MKRLVVILLMTIFLSTCRAPVKPKWIPFTYTAYGTPSAIAIDDIDKDGQNEILFTDSAGYLYVLHNDGTLNARLSLGAASYCPIVIMDVDNDGKKEMIAGNDEGVIRVFDSSFNLVWIRDYGNAIRKISVANINESTTDIVFFIEKTLFVVSGANGNKKWIYTAPDYINSFAIGDFVSINGLEIAFSDRDNNVYVLLANGSLWTKINIPSDPMKVISADLNEDGYEDIIFGANDNRVYSFTGNGTKLWDVNMTACISQYPAVADFNGDGVLEIVAVDSNNFLSVIEANGTVIFSRQMASGSSKSPSIFDVDGDGKLEIVVGIYRSIYVVNFANEIENILQADGSISTPVSAGMLRNPTISLVYSTGKIIREKFADGKRMFWYGAYGGGFDGCMRIHDADRDGVSDLSETLISTNPDSTDTDGDKLTDGFELYIGTNPVSSDTDSDGLSDSEEYYQYGTDPLNPDTDNDGYSDGEEVVSGTNPFDSSDHPETPQISSSSIQTNWIILGVIVSVLVVSLALFYLKRGVKTEVIG